MSTGQSTALHNRQKFMMGYLLNCVIQQTSTEVTMRCHNKEVLTVSSTVHYWYLLHVMVQLKLRKAQKQTYSKYKEVIDLLKATSI